MTSTNIDIKLLFFLEAEMLFTLEVPKGGQAQKFTPQTIGKNGKCG